MWRAHRWPLALAGALLISASAAQAADGIKASASASREVPADVLVVSFQITERFVPGEGATDQRGILARALEYSGLRVLERSSRIMPDTAVYGAHQIVSIAGNAREPLDVRRFATFRIAGFKRIDDVLDVLARHGVRRNVTLNPDHSRAEAVRQELRKEAIEGAIAQARRLAAQAGVKTGAVVDLSTQPPTVPGAWVMPYAPVLGANQNLLDPRHPGELPRLRLTATASVVLAVKAD